MANDFEIVKEDSHAAADLAMCLVTGGVYAMLGGCGSSTTYTVRDSSGTEHDVTARDKDELGEKIKRGEFD